MHIDPTNMEDDAIPSEMQDLLEEMKEAKRAKIESIGKYVAKRRDEAVKGRRQSGIETIWQEDNEYYEGLDEASSGSHPSAMSKSPSVSGGLSRTPNKATTRCTSFFNITRQFVESASARMGDILLPAGDWNFCIKPTPVQDVKEDAEVPEQVMPPQIPGQPVPELPMTAAMDPADKAQKEAEKKSEKAEAQIRDWLVECSYHTEVRKAIEDAAKIGTGILKGPYPEKVKSLKAMKSDQGSAIELAITTNPASKCVDPWDFFPDPTCGECIHDGNYVLERDRFSSRQLKDLKGVPGYLTDQIDKVLDEGPGKKNYDDFGRKVDSEKLGEDEKFEIWYYYGLIDKAGLSAMNVQINEKDVGKDSLPAIVTLVNDTPIKAFINPLDTGSFPYDVMPWQRMSGYPWGIGVSRQGRTAQDMLNAASRALMDNAGLSSGPQLIIRRGAIVPADGQWNLTARKVWYATAEADVRSVSDAFTSVNIPIMQAELSAIIQMAYKMMEDATGIFFIMQGQQGSAPDTVGGMELLHRNASAILRRLARVFDERVTEPHIRRYYEYLMLHGPDDCKGDMKIEAIGSTALVEREIQAMESMVLLQMAINPMYGLDPEKAMTEVLKTKRFIPEKWQMSEDKKKALQSQQAPIPSIEVAKIRAAMDEKTMLSREKIAQEQLNRDAETARLDQDRDLMYADTMARRDQTTTNIRMEELRIKREIALIDYANKRNINLDQIKAELAATSMKLRVMKELSGAAKAVKQTTTPPVEPIGRAEPGRAFEQ